MVLVTGASSGIGAAMARQLAPRARVLVLVARRVDRLRALAAELQDGRPSLQVDVRPCDLSDRTALRALAEGVLADHERVDVLVNNAGLGDIGLFEDAAPDRLAFMIDVNVVAPTLLTRLLLPAMRDAGRGAVLNVSSGFGLTWMPLFAAYAGTKHYLSAMTDALRAELAGTGVVVTQLCPGPVATEFEAVAGNPTGHEVPSFLELDPHRVARAGIAAVDVGRAEVIPGLLPWLAIKAGQWSPRWLLRLLYGAMGPLLRRRLSGGARRPPGTDGGDPAVRDRR